MSRLTLFGYAQARLQARHGTHPDAATWRRLNAVRSLAHFLQSARNTTLRPWVLHLGPHSPVHEVELSLRQQFRRYVREVAAWQPPDWRASVRWVARLPDLPALQHLLRGEAAPAWMLEDPRLKGFAHEIQAMRIQAIANSDCNPLLSGWNNGQMLDAAWYRHWTTLWPETTPDITGALDRVAAIIGEHYRALASPGAKQSSFIVDHLESALRAQFRRCPHQPAAAFVHLGLVAITLERLRGALSRRALFPETGEEEMQ